MPWDIADLPANGLRYRPRPIIQSYSAYTPFLQQLNKRHFGSVDAPSYLVLSASSIDGRNAPDLDYPSLEVIASRYQLIGSGSKGSLVLKRKPAIAVTRQLQWNAFTLVLRGDKINPPNVPSERWSQLPENLTPGSRFSIVVRPALWRRFQSIAFKPSPLAIAVKFNDGRIATHRILETTSQQIPLYPFVENSQSLRASSLAIQGTPGLKRSLGSKPESIRLIGPLASQGLRLAEVIIEQPIVH